MTGFEGNDDDDDYITIIPQESPHSSQFLVGLMVNKIPSQNVRENTGFYQDIVPLPGPSLEQEWGLIPSPE